MSTKQARRYDRGLWILEGKPGVQGFEKTSPFENISAEILEIGIGTGVNLPLYRGPGIRGRHSTPGPLNCCPEQPPATAFLHFIACSRLQASRLPLCSRFF